MCISVCISTALYHTITSLNVGRLLQNFIMEIKGKGQGHQNMKITVWAITFEPDVVDFRFCLVACCSLYIIESHIRHVVSVLTYDMPFLRHMTSFMTRFLKCSISNLLTTMVVVIIRPHRGHTINYEVIGIIILMLWLFYGRCMAPLGSPILD